MRTTKGGEMKCQGSGRVLLPLRTNDELGWYLAAGKSIKDERSTVLLQTLSAAVCSFLLLLLLFFFSLLLLLLLFFSNLGLLFFFNII